MFLCQVATLQQSICHNVLCSFTLVTKLMMLLHGMPHSTLKSAQDMALPLVLAWCFRLTDADVLRDFHTCHGEPDRMEESARTTPSAQDVAGITVALLTLILGCISG